VDAANSATSASNPYIEKIRQALREASRQIDLDSTETFAILGEQPPLATLHAQQALWQRRHQQISAELVKLSQRASGLRGALDRLAHLHDT
jgi:hypothetical protein